MGKAAYLMWDSNMSTFKMYVLILSVKPVILSHFAYEILWVKSQLVLFKHIFCCSQATHPFFGLTTTCFLPNVYWQPGIRKPWLVHWEPHAKSDDLLLNCIRLYPSSQLININIHLGLNLSVQSKILFSLSKPDETYDTSIILNLTCLSDFSLVQTQCLAHLLFVWIQLSRSMSFMVVSQLMGVLIMLMPTYKFEKHII